MADERVQVVDYDVAWPGRFAEQQPLVTELVAPWLAAPVEHIGSTSVPGLAAKPVIDMLAPVRSLAAAQAAVPALTAEGWLFWPDDPARSYRLWLLRPRPEARTHHLQVIEATDVHAVALLAFRDALRADVRLRGEYANLKAALAKRHAGSRNAYTNAKGDFIARALRQRGVEPPPRHLLPE